MSFSIDSILRNVSKVTLRGGVVGKITGTIMVVALALAGIAAAVRIEIVSILAVAVILVVALPLLWRLITFAKENPYAALLEGAELLKHEEMLMLGDSTTGAREIASLDQDVGPAKVARPDDEQPAHSDGEGA